METTNEVVYAYAAGLFDGEGSISIGKNSSGNTFNLIVRVAMKASSPAVKWLHDNFGGSYGEFRHIRHAKRSAYMSQWTLSGYDALGFLNQIKPYILERHEAVELALDFPMVGKGYHATPEQAEARGAIYDLMLGLNSKGKCRVKRL